MFKRRLRLPSPALVISIVALVFALGGTAVAAGTALHADQKEDTKLVKQLAPTLSVKAAKTVGGQKITSFYKLISNGDTTQEPVLSVGGLTLTISCAGGEPTVQATAADQGAFMRGTVVYAGGATTTGTSDANANLPLDVFGPGYKHGTMDLHYVLANGYRVDVDAVIDDTFTINGFDGCMIEGSAISG